MDVSVAVTYLRVNNRTSILRALNNTFLVILSEAKNLNVMLRFFVAPLLRMTSLEVLLDGLNDDSLPRRHEALSLLEEEGEVYSFHFPINRY